MQEKINSENFKVTCNKCGSKNIKLEVDWGGGDWEGGYWCNIEYVCLNEKCNNKEIVYDYRDQ